VQIRCNCFYKILKSASLFDIYQRAEDVGEIDGIILINVTSRDQALIRCEFAASVSAVNDVCTKRRTNTAKVGLCV
jgi:hypothetical protein